MDNHNLTDKPTDAVAQARDEYDYAREAWRSRPSEVTWQRVQQAWAEVLAAVRAECAANVRGFADAYPTDVWPETSFTDAQAASVMRLMVPRILAALEAQP